MWDKDNITYHILTHLSGNTVYAQNAASRCVSGASNPTADLNLRRSKTMNVVDQ